MRHLHSPEASFLVLEIRNTHVYVQGDTYRCGFYFDKYPDLEFQKLQPGDKIIYNTTLTLPGPINFTAAPATEAQKTEPTKHLRKYSITAATEQHGNKEN